MPVAVLIPSPAPSGSATPADPSTVTWKVFPSTAFASSTTLTQWHDDQTTDTLNDAGHGLLQLQNDDSQLASCPRGSVLQRSVDSTPAFSFIVDHTVRRSLAVNEEADQYTVLEGDGLAQVLNRAVVKPTRGYDEFPWATTRTFSFASPEYTPVGWSNAVNIVSAQKNTSAYYTGLPTGWMNPNASWIGASGTNDSGANEGSIYLIGDHTFVAGDIVAFAAADNRCDLYGDGFGLTTFGTEVGFNETHRTPILHVSAGQFRFGAKVVNYRDGATVDPPPGRGDFLSGDPLAFLFSAYPVDGRGRLGALGIQSDTEWSILEYPDTPPGWTVGGVMDLLLTEAQADGLLTGLTWDFDATNDSNGNPWTTYETITLNVGDDYLTVLRSFAGAYCDWAFAPDSLNLSMYRLGERGSVIDIGFVAGTNLTSLTHDAIDVGTDALLVSWNGPQFLYPSSGGSRIARFDAGNAKTRDEAETLAAQQLALLGGVRIEFQADIEPVGLEDQPYTGFTVGDIVGIPDETGAASSQRVTQIVGTTDPEGNPVWSPSFSDVLLDVNARLANNVRRMASGTLGGYSTVASPQGPLPVFGSKIESSELSFSVPDNAGTVTTGVSTKTDAVSASGNLFGVLAILNTAATAGATTFTYLLDGADVLGGTGSIAAGVSMQFFPVDLGASQFTAWLEGNKSRLSANVTAAGTGAQGLVLKGQVL